MKIRYMKPLVLTLLIAFKVFMASGQDTESIIQIGESASVSYVMYTDNDGNLFYVNTEDHYLDLIKYDMARDTVIKISDNFTDDHTENGKSYNEGFGSIAPSVTGDTVYCMTTAGTNHGNAEIFRLVCSSNTLEYVTDICGTNLWMIFNLTLSRDGKTLYYIGNNTPSNKALYKIELATLECSKILDLDPVIPHRDLCFGGINVWDNYDNFYLPVWSWDYDPGDLAVLKIHTGQDDYSAVVLEFTDDGSLSGELLFPEFRHHSCWSGIGASTNGDIYIAASNHYQSSNGSGEHGNVAIYRYEPETSKMKLLGDLKSVSEAVGNWMQGESQHKVHTFIMESADGKMYFASNDYYPSHFIRGSHIYTIDTESDELEDYSKTQSYVMRRDFSLVENVDYASESSGVFTEYYGIKGISLNRNAPEILYAMTFSNPGGIADPGYIIKHRVEGDLNSGVESRMEELEVKIYPNPFADQVMFELNSLNSDKHPVLRIFDIHGRMVFEKVISGRGPVNWYGKDSDDRELPPGVYFYSIKSGSVQTGKILKIE